MTAQIYAGRKVHATSLERTASAVPPTAKIPAQLTSRPDERPTNDDWRTEPVRDATTLRSENSSIIEQTAKKPKRIQFTSKPHVRPPLSQEGLATEVWLPIKGHESRYEVSTSGRIRSTYKNLHSSGRPRKNKECLSTRVERDGYERFTTSFIENGIRRTIALRVHRVVATAFVANPEHLPIVHHKDSNKLNNCADNLEWTTQKKNVQYAIEQIPGRREALKRLHTYSSRANPGRRKNDISNSQNPSAHE